MMRYFDIVGNTLIIIFTDQLSGVSFFKRTYEKLDDLFTDLDSFQEDDIIDSFEMLKKHPLWFPVILENYVDSSSPSGAVIL